MADSTNPDATRVVQSAKSIGHLTPSGTDDTLMLHSMDDVDHEY